MGLSIAGLAFFEQRLAAMHPKPCAHGEGICAVRAFKRTHTALLRAAWTSALAEYLDAELTRGGIDEEIEHGKL